MSLQDIKTWEIAAGAVVVAGLGTVGAWMLRRKRPTPEEIETNRRKLLTQAGRLVDGTLLEVCEIPAEDGQMLTMLLYDYRIGGVDYQCSQDITNLQNILDPNLVRAGFPCSVRYQQGNPQNSIVVSENWSGLRLNAPSVQPSRTVEEIEAPIALNPKLRKQGQM